ncbi:WxL domain-containing protein [Lactococcus lactis]|uniref:WxL domain-containing protein n=1 Tax=Lactococcus lactis TaxID=1358 RepID=UPI0022E103FB|nr:WxL domain-containing protein [Lactococcus lactis]
MGKIKNLLKKSTNIGASALLLVSTLLPILALHGETIVSAANATTTLNPGGTVDTGNHTWNIDDFRTPGNFTPVGKNTSGASWTSISTYDFGTNQRDTGSWLPFNGAVDMTQPLSLAGSTYASAGWLGTGSGSQLGDANGVLLTNLSSSQLSGGSTGGNLGVGNLGSGTYFIGNNYSYRKTSIILGSDYNTATVIAQGVGSPGSGGGKTILNASSDYTAKNNSSNAFEMYWSNPVLNSDGTVTGTMSYRSRNANTDYTASAKLTVQKSMSIGFMAATGGNYSQMSVTVSLVGAGKGVQPVNVNYLNSTTGGQLAPKGSAWKNSTITANVGDKIGVVPQGNTTNTSDNYDYFAPVAPTGYTFKSTSSAVTVQNFPSGTANPNQINVSYTPLAQTGGFTYNYDPTAQRTPGVPTKLSVSGVTDQLFSASSLNVQKNLTDKVPAGYYISKITSASGKATTGATTDATIKAFFALKPSFDTTTTNNQYQVTLAPTNQTGQVSFAYGSVPAAPPALPNNIQLSGLTGSDLNFVMPTLTPGYVVSGVLGPDNVTYSSVAEALKANDHFTTGSNNFKVTIAAEMQIGTISYNWASNVPGQNGVAGELQATLPSDSSIAGFSGEMIQFSPNVPLGYAIDKVVAPDGKTYVDGSIQGMTALEAAQAANPRFIVGANNFAITLRALSKDITLQVNIDQSSGTGAPTAPQPYTIATVLTGAPIDATSIDKAQNWLNDWITNNASGWSIKDFLSPYRVSYGSLKDAVAGAGGVAFSEVNIYQANLVYNGKIDFSSVPTKIDFGENTISSVEKSYQGVLDNSVVVSDTRATNLATPWTVSVAQTSPIQEVMSDTGAPVMGGISFMNYLSYDGQVLTSNPQIIHSTTSGKTGDTVVIDGKSPSLFTLRVPIGFQKADANFKGTLSWTLTSAP